MEWWWKRLGIWGDQSKQSNTESSESASLRSSDSDTSEFQSAATLTLPTFPCGRAAPANIIRSTPAKDKKAFGEFHPQTTDEITVIDMGNLSLYLGCALERDAAKGVVKITQTVLFVKPLVYLFDIPFETETPASVEYVSLVRRGLTSKRKVIDPIISRVSLIYCAGLLRIVGMA